MSGLDFSKLSDDELYAMAETGGVSNSTQKTEQDFSSMSDDELYEMAAHGGRPPLPAPKPTKGITGAVVDGGLWALDKLDSVTGAPTRAALDAAIDGNNPLSAFGKQFAEDTAKAPTGKTIAQKVGVGDESLSDAFPDLYNEDGEGWQLQKGGWGDISKSGAAGLGIDVAADWSNLVGVGLLKGGAKAAGQATKAAATVGKNATLNTLEAGAKAVGKGLGKTVDVATGSKAGTNAIEGLSKFVKPEVAEDFKRFAEIAKKNNIDPAHLNSAVEFGPGSFISRAERNLAEGPIGQMRLEKHRAGLEAVQEAVEKRISDISGGSVMDEVAAGQHAREAFDRGVDKFFQGIDWTHNMVQEAAPGLRLSDDGAKALSSKLAGVEKYAKGLVSRGVTKTQKTQGQQLLSAVESIRRSNGSYKQIYEAQRMIGDAAFKAKNSLADIPPDVEKLRDIYFAIDDALIDTTRKGLGDDIAERLVENNKQMSEFFGQKGVLSPIIGSKGLSNEQVFKSLVLNGDSKKIEALKKVLAPEDFKQLQGAFLESLIRRNPDGTVKLGSLHGQLQGKKNQIRALFGDVENIKDVTELIELGERMGPAVLSSSGTGASNAFRQLATGVADSIGSDVILEKMKGAARTRSPLKGAARTRSPLKLIDEITDIQLPPKSAPPKLMDELKKIPMRPVVNDPAAVNAARAGFVGAKLSSTDRANEKPTDKLLQQIDENPRLLESIKNPNLKRQLESQLRQLREQREMQSFDEQMQNNVREAQDSFIEGN